jgi:hypothetical protein
MFFAAFALGTVTLRKCGVSAGAAFDLLGVACALAALVFARRKS